MVQQRAQQRHNLIGVFDSGVGGLSVLRAIRQFIPGADLLYLADQAHVPYGTRSKSQIQAFSIAITDFLLSQGAGLIVVACNTASAAALHDLRSKFPDVPFVGMEPAVKPAAEMTHTGTVGVLATPTTFEGGMYASLVERFARDVRLLHSTCPGLVEQIEDGDLDTQRTREILEDALEPILSAGADTIVMGCTHYPFVIPSIEAISGPGVRVIDPAPAVARQTQRLILEYELENPATSQGQVQLMTSGSPAKLVELHPYLLGEKVPVAGITWMTDPESGQPILTHLE